MKAIGAKRTINADRDFKEEMGRRTSRMDGRSARSEAAARELGHLGGGTRLKACEDLMKTGRVSR